MTTFRTEVIQCAVCREFASFRVIGSTSSFGSCDLDLRPSEPARFVMGGWQQECPKCGYVNVNIGSLLPDAEGIIRSTEFAVLRSSIDEPALVNRFKRHALLVADDAVKAGWTMLHAAWVCDDLALEQRSRDCREECADFWSSLEYGSDESSTRLRTVMVDVLRRAERFDEADTLADIALLGGGATETMRKVLGFQRRLISAYDVRPYTVDQAIRASAGAGVATLT